MSEITTIGLDLAKQVFQVRGVDGAGAVMLRRQSKRRQVEPFFAKLPGCLVGIKACGTARHWGHRPTALGHQVRLIPPAYAKAYVRRNKTDPADAEAIWEAVNRAVNALCAAQERRRSGDGRGAPGARAADRATHDADQHAARPYGGIGIVAAAGPQRTSRSWSSNWPSPRACPSRCATRCWRWSG
jgi:transposase